MKLGHILGALTLLMATASVAQPTACAGRDLVAGMAAAERDGLMVAVNRAPFATGNRWRATRGARTIEVVGTLHIFDPRMTALAETLRPTIAQADQVYLEATESEISELKRAITTRPEAIVTSGPTLPERLQAAEWQMLAAAMEERGVPAFVASKFQPWYVSILLALPPCAMAAMAEGSAGLDQLIGEIAEAEGVPSSALEPYDTILTIFGSIDPAEQLDMIRASLTTSDRSEDMLATMIESYFRQEHRLIWEFNRHAALAAAPELAGMLEQDFAAMEEALIIRRNLAWIEAIEANAQDRLVVAVGAAHLGGEKGLLQLLADAGYRLERIGA